MFDGLDDLSGNRKIPTGTHQADITGVFQDEEKGTVGIRFYFPSFELSLSERHYLRKKDGGQNKVGADILAKQMRNAKFEVRTGEQLKNALNNLQGLSVLVDVSNRKGTDYQHFYISGLGEKSRSIMADSDEVVESVVVDDDLPF
jgi:hypothetical protein